MEPGHTKALETRLRWLRWAEEEGVQVWSDISRASKKPYMDVLPAYKSTLEHGDTFFMNRQFCDLVEHARKTVPDELVFESSWMQSQEGWLWLETPVEIPLALLTEEGKVVDTTQKPPVVSAVGWFPVPEGTPLPPGSSRTHAGRGAYMFLCFQDLNHYESGHPGFGCWSYFLVQEGDRLIDRIEQFEAKQERERVAGNYAPSAATKELHEIRWVYTGFYLMAQRLALLPRREIDRAQKRRFEHAKYTHPSYIRVVTLRRLEQDRKKAEESGKHIDWQWQWSVRGHWRNQYFKSTGEHKQIFIEAFIKGPKDKPMKPDSVKLFVARR